LETRHQRTERKQAREDGTFARNEEQIRIACIELMDAKIAAYGYNGDNWPK
jgi:hypothetical protein